MRKPCVLDNSYVFLGRSINRLAEYVITMRTATVHCAHRQTLPSPTNGLVGPSH
jgi:hypothetical protein